MMTLKDFIKTIQYNEDDLIGTSKIDNITIKLFNSNNKEIDMDLEQLCNDIDIDNYNKRIKEESDNLIKLINKNILIFDKKITKMKQDMQKVIDTKEIQKYPKNMELAKNSIYEVYNIIELLNHLTGDVIDLYKRINNDKIKNLLKLSVQKLEDKFDCSGKLLNKLKD